MSVLSKPLSLGLAERRLPRRNVLLASSAALGLGAALCYGAWRRYAHWQWAQRRQRQPHTLRSSAASAVSLEAAEKAAERAAAKEHAKEKKIKAHVDKHFFMQLCTIVRIIVPRFFSPEVFYLILIAVSLLCRTYADVWMITNTTIIENGIIQRNSAMFKKFLFRYFTAMPAISFVNNLLKLGISELKLRFRSRLSKHLYEQYLKEFTFYKMSNLDNRIANADQLLTQDVEKFCDGIVDLYSNLSKPLVDVTLYIYKLGSSIGYQAPLSLLAYLFASGILLTRLRRPIGRLTVREQQLEGEYRFVNSRLIINSEEIAFYGGQHHERALVGRVFDRLVAHLRKAIYFRFGIGFLDNIIAKYCATVVGWLVVSRPFLSAERNQLSHMDRNQLVQVYYDNGRMMFSLAVALGRLALAGRELTRLAGFTTRMGELMAVLRDLNAGKYTRTMVNATAHTDGYGNDNAGSDVDKFRPGTGQLVIQDYVIKFDAVPLVTPNGDVLVDKLDLEVRSGVNVLVCGPNGCGKSSLFRVLGELWPLFGGTLTKPDSRNLFYIPQRPYMTLGTLRDQIIYPDSVSDMRAKCVSDEQLGMHLERVQLRYILAREGGWHAQQDWMDVLSGGEKQRVAMARLFYHQPQFAILDECTSAVSVDVEGNMYSYCKEVGITLFTVSHRKSLWRYHEYYLHMDGRGSYTFAPIDSDTQEFGS